MRSEGCVPGRKVCKDKLSAMMCANADGTDRITCAIVGKSKKPRALQHCMDRLPVKYYNSKNAWFTQEIFLSWFHDVFCREVRAYQIKKLKIRPSKVRALLLLDNAPAHPRIGKLTSHDGKITCMALPPNTTSLIQPMDQGVICATKRLYTKKMLNEVLVVLPLPEDIELGVDNRAKKTLQNLKNYTIKEAVYNWAKVWSELKESTLKNSWKKLLTSTVRNEEDEEMDFEGFTDEIHGMFRNAGENLERQDVVDWLEQDANDAGYGVMSEDEILQSVTAIEVPAVDVPAPVPAADIPAPEVPAGGVPAEAFLLSCLSLLRQFPRWPVAANFVSSAAAEVPAADVLAVAVPAIDVTAVAVTALLFQLLTC
ncbi:tigger transposable element-derived protein 7-like [Procambarus clarkii]|uniref:tigger transposable element-derived protein 7-like n=1 Tax=Procambarus clarkii TaxID=6728 RepID=UPI00374239E2